MPGPTQIVEGTPIAPLLGSREPAIRMLSKEQEPARWQVK